LALFACSFCLPALPAGLSSKVQEEEAGNSTLAQDIGKFAEDVLAALEVPRKEPNKFYGGGIFATTREAIHSHSKEWWTLLLQTVTDKYRFAKSFKGPGDRLIERYWHVFLDPEDTSAGNGHGCPA